MSCRTQVQRRTLRLQSFSSAACEDHPNVTILQHVNGLTVGITHPSLPTPLYLYKLESTPLRTHKGAPRRNVPGDNSATLIFGSSQETSTNILQSYPAANDSCSRLVRVEGMSYDPGPRWLYTSFMVLKRIASPINTWKDCKYR